MILKSKTKNLKIKEKFGWQIYFALWPRRVSETEIVWLEKAARRIVQRSSSEVFINTPHWNY